MRARSRRAHGCALSEPRSLLAQFAGQDARQTADARVSFSWLLLFGQAKRSNSAAMDGRRKSQGRESETATPLKIESKSVQRLVQNNLHLVPRIPHPLIKPMRPLPRIATAHAHAYAPFR